VAIDEFDRYMYIEHAQGELRAWARSVRHVRYCRAYGGATSDTDTLRVTLAAPDRTTLLTVARALGVVLTEIAADAPRRVEGRGYTIQELHALPRPIDIAPDLSMPYEVEVADVRLALWIHGGRVELTLHPASWSLTADDFAAGRRVDEAVVAADLIVLDPPLATRHCLCPRFHPRVWQD
jgi:hypothetical protein